eukprot:g3440.t1
MSSTVAHVDELLGTRLHYSSVTIDPCVRIPQDFMVDHMGFENLQNAKLFRDEWFGRYHSTVKGFVKSGEQGMLPPMQDGTVRKFDRERLIRYYVRACDRNQGLKYLLPCIDNELRRTLGDLRNRGMRLVIFTNGPRSYGCRVLKTLKLFRYFDEADIFGVDTIRPFCKPEPESFLEVLGRIGADPSRSVMFEDSVKNIRTCKKLGMHTVLVTGKDPSGLAAQRAYASKGGEMPDESDPSVDAVLRTCADMRSKLPCLWTGHWDCGAA